MKVTKVPLLDTGYFSGLTSAYLSNDNRLRAFYNHYFDIHNVKQAIVERVNFETNRINLHGVLHQQHAPYYTSFPNLEKVVDSIKDKQTFTITTGHQICLATGPLYFIYKIASAINLCRKLKQQYPEQNFVPVYWMATEDHDFEEINHIHLFNKKITWNKEVQGATGRISTTGIESFLNDIEEILGDKVNSIKLFEVIKYAYQKHSNLADATRYLVLHLFGEQNLLVLDADHKILKDSFKELIKKDILGQISDIAVKSTINEIVAADLIKEDKIQVKPRPINFFYLNDNLRKRITLEDGIYHVLETDITFTEAALLNEIDSFPERFSPNVIMRPVYQECILPNIVYIGGAGELSYWFELKATFDNHGIFFPMLALRNSFLWLDQKQGEKLHQLGISNNEIFDSIEILIAKFLKNIGAEELQFKEEQVMVNQLFEQLKTKVSAIDITLTNTAEAEKHKLLKSLEMLEQKTIKAQKNKHEISINQLKKIKESLFPEGGLQERYENILWLNMKFGNEVINLLIELADLESKAFVIISA